MAKIKTAGTAYKTKPKNINKRSFEKVYWPFIPVVLAIGILLSVGASSGNLQAYVKHPDGRVLAYSSSMSIGGLLADTNTARAANGVAALSLSAKLDAAAQNSADDMAARNYWSHNTPEGNPPWIWVTGQGYSYQKLGQNLATGFSDEQNTINGWMNSPPHRENLLDPAFKEVGFGYANNPDYTAAGGGPMTIIVAFYGQPKVLSAATPAPVAPTVKPATPSAPQPTAAAQQPAQSPAPASSVPKPSNPVVTSQPETAKTAEQSGVTPAKQTRIQVTLSNSKIAPAAGATSLLAIIIFAFWASRHMRTLHKFLLKGERYVVRHPLTDIGLLILACLLFILSQTAGLIQ
jgi:hypothetical protein